MFDLDSARQTVASELSLESEGRGLLQNGRLGGNTNSTTVNLARSATLACRSAAWADRARINFSQ
jgi:hypothetical protein